MTNNKFQYTPWTIGLIQGSMQIGLDARLEALIKLKESINKAIQTEIDFIYAETERRIKS